VLAPALTGLASDFALGTGSAVLASRRLTSLFSLLAGALLGAILYPHHGTALPLALAAAAELISATVFPRTKGSGSSGGRIARSSSVLPARRSRRWQRRSRQRFGPQPIPAAVKRELLELLELLVWPRLRGPVCRWPGGT
jgi:hypothetical protein